MNRRELLATSAALAATAASSRFAFAASPATAPMPTTTTTTTKPAVPDDVKWHDVRDFGVEGRAFADTENFFDRLPARAKHVVRDQIWDLSRHSAGMSARFITDATDIYIRHAVINKDLAMSHMPTSGVSGLDLYAHLENTWQWLATHHPGTPFSTAPLVEQIAPGKRLYQLNLPLYNGTKSLEIGTHNGASFEPVPPRTEKPILFYGTSITQGACASRPGMAFLNILGRRLDRPMLNFGFSGNGQMELDVAKLLTEIDAALFVIDCSANMSGPGIAHHCGPLVKFLRSSHPSMPILLLNERPFANAPLVPKFQQLHAERSRALKNAFDELISAGVSHVHWNPADEVIGSDGEATVDGSHPNDLGMMRYADALEPVLRTLLGN